MTEPEQISHHQAIFDAANVVEEMCNDANDKKDLEEDIPKLILYCALVVEHAADFIHRNLSERYVLAAP